MQNHKFGLVYMLEVTYSDNTTLFKVTAPYTADEITCPVDKILQSTDKAYWMVAEMLICAFLREHPPLPTPLELDNKEITE